MKMNDKVISSRAEELLRFRIFIPAAFSFVCLLILTVVLFFEQVRSGEHHRQQVSRQSVRQIRIPAQRGMIYTRDLKQLTENYSSFELLFYPGEMRKRKRRESIRYMLNKADEISEAIGINHNLTAEKINRHINMRPGLPLPVLQHLSEKTAARAMEAVRGIPGAELEPMGTRGYPEKRLACHLVGYTRPADPQKAPDRTNFFYYLPDDVGVAGVEKLCDGINMENNLPVLRGIPGYSLIQVDHQGYARKNIIERIEPVNGNHVILTIDSVLQKTAEKLLEGKRGALVAVDASNGDILAAASAPGYDIGLFMPKISNKDYAALRDAPDRPLINRALQGVYPPGSILKPLIMLAYLENGIDPAKEVECNGYSQIYNVRIRCTSYRRGGHGMMNMHDALKYSCNAYMIELSQTIGLSPMQKVINEAGLCSKTGIGLPESAGFFPDSKLKRTRNGTKWNKYDTALLSIGQGLIGITPLQAALYCASLANGGIVWKPNLVSKMVDASGNDLWFRTPRINSRLNVKPESLQKIANGMFDVVNSGDGSGRSAAVKNLQLRGKTGSAEFGQKGNLKIYAWFIAHAKVKDKNIALAVVIEEGDSGGRTCAPLAAEFFKAAQAR